MPSRGAAHLWAEEPDHFAYGRLLGNYSSIGRQSSQQFLTGRATKYRAVAGGNGDKIAAKLSRFYHVRHFFEGLLILRQPLTHAYLNENKLAEACASRRTDDIRDAVRRF